MYSDFNSTFYMSVSGEKELTKTIANFKSIKDKHPFYISYSGIAPSVLHMNPSSRVIFVKHQDGLSNASAGLADYLRALVKSVGIESRVGLLNS